MNRVTGQELNVVRLPAGRPAAYYLQYHYIVTNPIPKDRRDLVDDPGDGSAYTRQHTIYHPLMRASADRLRLLRSDDADPKTGRLVLHDRQGSGFRGFGFAPATFGRSNVAAAVARCAFLLTGRPCASRTSPPTRRRAARRPPSWRRR
jgi:hypothetical protein